MHGHKDYSGLYYTPRRGVENREVVITEEKIKPSLLRNVMFSKGGFYTFAIGVVGAVIGSFVNVVVFGEAKGKILSAEDPIALIVSIHYVRGTYYPLLSFLLRGKCLCKQSISIRYFLVEMIFSFYFV